MDGRINDFINKDKSLLIAPAGYGKTHFLAECIKHTPENSKQLILTHTHAGIASIKQKINKLSIPARKYHIETISGFVQKYVLSFHCGDTLNQETKDYFDKVIQASIKIFNSKAVQKTIVASYDGLFVDEYQDCTKSQHEITLALSQVLPTHILGDPLQGIFDFNESLVDFDTDLDEFERVKDLDIPWRWKQDGNSDELGDVLKEIRDELNISNVSTFTFPESKGYVFSVFEISESDIYKPQSIYRKHLNTLISNPNSIERFNSILFLIPEYIDRGIPKGNTASRAKLKTTIDYSKQLRLLESFDNRDYYNVVKIIDALVEGIHRKRKKVARIKENLLFKLFNKTEINLWFGVDNVKSRQGVNKAKSTILKELVSASITLPSYQAYLALIAFLKNELKLKHSRPELVFSIVKALNIAIENDELALDAMKRYKNIKRVVGRKVDGKYLGTTLLTKGLEFDTVVILNAHRYTNPKHLYVALTRAAKQVVIFTECDTIRFKHKVDLIQP